jgi:hypothetical protein
VLYNLDIANEFVDIANEPADNDAMDVDPTAAQANEDGPHQSSPFIDDTAMSIDPPAPTKGMSFQ